MTALLPHFANPHYIVPQIQGLWRGYYVRKYVFDYYAQREYLEGLVRKNELVRYVRWKEIGGNLVPLD